MIDPPSSRKPTDSRTKQRFSAWTIRRLGHLAVHGSIFHKQLKALAGLQTQRVIEYRWVMKTIDELLQAGFLPRGCKVLDVGVAESVFHYELVHKGFQVYGLDIIGSPLLHPKMIFLQRPLQDTGLPNDSIHLVVVISTIEHIGLAAYGQEILDYDADFKCSKEIHRILKQEGYLVVTTPFEGITGFHVDRSGFERHYDLERLRQLFPSELYTPMKEEYFYLNTQSRRVTYSKFDRESLPPTLATTLGDYANLACVLLKKR